MTIKTAVRRAWTDTSTGTKRRAGFFLCSTALVLALITATTQRTARMKSIEEEQFDSFFEEEPFVQSSEPQTPDILPKIVLTINKEQGTSEQWMLDPLSRPESRERVGRILALIREARLLSLALPEEGLLPRLTLLVEGKGQVFKAAFTPDQIHDNPPAQLMLKLFQLYASEQQSMPVVAGPAGTASDSEPQT